MGTTLGYYKVLEVIATGDDAAVYKVQDSRNGKISAMKNGHMTLVKCQPELFTHELQINQTVRFLMNNVESELKKKK